MISLLRKGQNGEQILKILDEITQQESVHQGTLDEIEFWISTRCASLQTGTSYLTNIGYRLDYGCIGISIQPHSHQTHGNRIRHAQEQESAQSLCEPHGSWWHVHHRTTCRHPRVSYIIQRAQSLLGRYNQWPTLGHRLLIYHIRRGKPRLYNKIIFSITRDLLILNNTILIENVPIR